MEPPEISPKEVRIEAGWRQALGDEFAQPYMSELREFLLAQYRSGKKIYPRTEEYFAAFNLTPFAQTKVVILGQDPYHGPGQAHGLCFSVQPQIPPPPSLVNIFKELKADIGAEPPANGSLVPWARQGVLLLNATLTVEEGRAGSHQGRGWERFTDRVIEVLNENHQHLVFILWGNSAQKKAQNVDRSRHLVLMSAHPSPLSAHRGFFGSRPFSQTNRYLEHQGVTPIRWQLLSAVSSAVSGAASSAISSAASPRSPKVDSLNPAKDDKSSIPY